MSNPAANAGVLPPNDQNTTNAQTRIHELMREINALTNGNSTTGNNNGRFNTTID